MTPKIPEALIARKCKVCAHCRQSEPNEDSTVSALSSAFRSPCQIYAIALIYFDEAECMSFAPKMWVQGICQTCGNRNRFFPTGCKHEVEQRRIVFRTSRPIAQAECCTCDRYTPGWMLERMVRHDVATEACPSVIVRPAPPTRPFTNAELRRLQGIPEQISMDLEGLADDMDESAFTRL